MGTVEMIVLDFETYPIVPLRPHYPPKPVGLAIKWEHNAPEYVTGDERMREALCRAQESKLPLIFHNAPFDVAVAEECLDVPAFDWSLVHDTMILAFLFDPYGPLGLKELTKTLLDMPNDDVSELHSWIMANKAAIEREYGATITKRNIGAYICAVPEPMRKRYALADVERTYHLFRYLAPHIVEDAGLLKAYKREMHIAPILLDNARAGLRVDKLRLERDILDYQRALWRADSYVRTVIGAEFNLDSNDELIAALIRTGEIDPAKLPKTLTGKISANKEALHPDNFKSPSLAHVLGYRSRLATCLTTFMVPWQKQAHEWGGRISTQWHQTRAEAGGMKTGRIGSSDHNFLNLPKSFVGRDDGYQHPSVIQVPELPLCRQYILPEEGHVFLHRDFDGQELRMFAHFEQGALMEQYQQNPNLDVHSYIKAVCDELSGRDLDRTKVKIMNFTALYGGGIPAIAKRLRISREDAVRFKRLHDRALPGRLLLNEEIVRLSRRGEKIRTWGGRLYGMPPGDVGEDTSYKLLNYLIQGSSADLTKQSIVYWHTRAKARLLTTVYDEINVSAHKDYAEQEMRILKESMEAPRCRVAMLSKGKQGPNWGDLKSCA